MFDINEYQHIFHEDLMVDKVLLFTWEFNAYVERGVSYEFYNFLTRVQDGDSWTWHLDMTHSYIFEWDSDMEFILDLEEFI
jgi:hypothetical protein